MGSSWAQGIEPTDYRPENLFITTNTILAYTGDAAGRDLSVLDGALAGDLYGPTKKQYEEPGMQECLGVLERRRRGGRGSGHGRGGRGRRHRRLHRLPVHDPVRGAGQKAGKDLNYATFRAAAEGLSVEIPGDPDPYTFGSPPHADGDPPVYVYEWDSANKDFVAAES